MNKIKSNISYELENINDAMNIFSDHNIKIFYKLIKESKSKINKKKKIFWGKGGSASNAQHLA